MNVLNIDGILFYAIIRVNDGNYRRKVEIVSLLKFSFSCQIQDMSLIYLFYFASKNIFILFW